MAMEAPAFMAITVTGIRSGHLERVDVAHFW